MRSEPQELHKGEASGRPAREGSPRLRRGGRESDKTEYPIICIKAAEAIARGEADRAVLSGGTGLGEAISANKVRGIRAAVAVNPYSIERSILSNDCQVLCLGERMVTPELADRVVRQCLGYEFDTSSPSARVKHASYPSTKSVAAYKRSLGSVPGAHRGPLSGARPR